MSLSQKQQMILTASDLAVKCFDYELIMLANPEHKKEIFEIFEKWRGLYLLAGFFTMDFIQTHFLPTIESKNNLKRFLSNFDARLRLAWADQYQAYSDAVISSHCNRKEIESGLFYLLNKNMEHMLHVDEKDLREFSSANPWYIGMYLVLANLGHSSLKVVP